MGLNALPNFLVIGAEKSGTTWLKHNLKDHPEIFIPPEKELHFFDKSENYDRGLDWYSTFFEANQGKPVLGEITPGYLAEYKKASIRIHDTFPKIKLIAILRNPVDRAWSNYQMNKADGKLEIGFDECIDSGHAIIQKGHYKKQLISYFEKFSRSQILVLDYDLITTSSHELLKSIFQFLNVDVDYNSPKSDQIIFASRRTKYPLLVRILKIAAKTLRQIGFTFILNKYRKRVKFWLKRNNTVVEPKPDLPETLRKKLIDIYKLDLEFLESIWGYSLDKWRK